MTYQPDPVVRVEDLVTAGTSLASVVTAWTGASRVFARHNLDFCCNGNRSIATACREQGLDVEAVLAELRAAIEPIPALERWDERPVAQLLTHLVDHYHSRHRAELPRLQRLAIQVEDVHGDKPECPHGLADSLAKLAEALEAHMNREENGIFPVLLNGRSDTAALLMAKLEREHREQGFNLVELRRLTNDFTVPEGACNAWRALYHGLTEFEREMMQHVHLENHVLVPRFVEAG